MDKKLYIGTKIIEARAGFDPKGNGSEEGYDVWYPDGYKSWSPKDVFEKAYKLVDTVSFGDAIIAMKQGFKVARKGWNGKGMFIYLQNSYSDYEFADAMEGITRQDKYGEFVLTDPYICMKTVGNTVQPGWLASQADMLAEDWEIVQ